MQRSERRRRKSGVPDRNTGQASRRRSKTGGSKDPPLHEELGGQVLIHFLDLLAQVIKIALPLHHRLRRGHQFAALSKSRPVSGHDLLELRHRIFNSPEAVGRSPLALSFHEL